MTRKLILLRNGHYISNSETGTFSNSGKCRATNIRDLFQNHDYKPGVIHHSGVTRGVETRLARKLIL